MKTRSGKDTTKAGGEDASPSSSLDTAATAAAAAFSSSPPVLSRDNNKKRRKEPSANKEPPEDENDAVVPETALTAPATTTFRGKIPKEVIALIAQYCTRRSLANLMQTSRGNYETIIDPNFVPRLPWLWPTKCPPFITPEERACGWEVSYSVTSNNGMFLAVCKSAGRDVPGKIQVWCRYRGQLIELQFPCMKGLIPVVYQPVFSPDSTLLILPPSGESYDPRGLYVGIRVCQLPSTTEMEERQVRVTKHHLLRDSRTISSITFSDNNTIYFIDALKREINQCTINYPDNGQITFEPAWEFLPNDRFQLDQRRTSWTSSSVRLASFADKHKHILAMNNGQSVVFHDLRRNRTASMNVFPGESPPENAFVGDLAFSPNGRVLVVVNCLRELGEPGECFVAVADCDVDRVEDITINQQMRIQCKLDQVADDIRASFLGDSSYVAMFTLLCGTKKPRARIIDLHAGEFTSDNWDSSSWWEYMS